MQLANHQATNLHICSEGARIICQCVSSLQAAASGARIGFRLQMSSWHQSDVYGALTVLLVLYIDLFGFARFTVPETLLRVALSASLFLS